MRVTRRHLQVSLGVLWLLDGALQLQPFMFTRGFAAGVIGQAAQGQPAFVADPVRWAAGIIGAHPLPADLAFAGVQIAIGAGLLFRPLARAALAGSIGWALGVWLFGEGLGGIAGGHTSLLGGAPGAALLYAVVSAAAWPAPEDARLPRRSGIMAGAGDSSGSPRGWVVGAWVLLWAGGATLRALPAQAGNKALRQGLLDAAQGAPAWLAGWDHAAAGWAGSAPGLLGAVIVAVEALVGLLALSRGRLRVVAAGAGAAAALAVWVLGEGMGQIYTGQATDPNAGPLIVLLAVALAATGTGAERVGRRAAAGEAHGAAPAVVTLRRPAWSRSPAAGRLAR